MNTVRCGFGIGNRVGAMANGLSRFAEISFVWRVNGLCPLTWQEVFPKGILGVTFITDAPPAFATWWGSHQCDKWEAAGNRARANSAFGLIMSSMVGKAQYNPPPFTALCRFRYPKAPQPEEFAVKVIAEAKARNVSEVYLVADSKRREMTYLLTEANLHVHHQKSPEMSDELTREPAQVLAWLDDWKTLSLTQAIIANPARTSVVHPARAAGVEIISA